VELTPQQVRLAKFSLRRKGFDPTEVSHYLNQVAEEMARLHNHAVAMERMARASKERLSALTGLSDPSEVIPDGDPTPVERALLLAHRAAEAVRVQANKDAKEIVAKAQAEAENSGAAQTARLREEIDVLTGKREFLAADIEQLEDFIAAQRRRIHSAGREMLAFAENVPLGLGHEAVLHPDQESLKI